MVLYSVANQEAEIMNKGIGEGIAGESSLLGFLYKSDTQEDSKVFAGIGLLDASGFNNLSHC